MCLICADFLQIPLHLSLLNNKDTLFIFIYLFNLVSAKSD